MSVASPPKALRADFVAACHSEGTVANSCAGWFGCDEGGPIVKLGPVAQNPIEAVALLSGLVPTPLGDTIIAMMLARTIMVACKLDVFEALADQPLMSNEVARTCGLSEHGTQALLFALEGAGYVRRAGAAYTLTRSSRKWLLKSSPDSLYDYMLFSFLSWQWIDRCEAFVRSGTPSQVHAEMSDEEWGIYQRGMRSLASICAP